MVLTIMYRTIQSILSRNWPLLLCLTPFSIVRFKVVAEDAAKTKTLADSIYTAIKGGADFAEIAKKYGQTGEATWISSANYEGAQVDGDNLKILQPSLLWVRMSWLTSLWDRQTLSCK